MKPLLAYKFNKCYQSYDANLLIKVLSIKLIFLSSNFILKLWKDSELYFLSHKDKYPKQIYETHKM